MVKSYLKYEFYGTAAVIASHNSNLACWPTPGAALPKGGPRPQPLVIAPALETVGCWNAATQALEGGYRPEEEVRRAEVTALALDGSGSLLAIGHHNGGVCVCEFPSFDIRFTAVQHVSGRAVTCLAWSPTGALLASGAQDTEIIVWDVASQEPIQHLKGHTGPISGLRFLGDTLLLSAGSKEDCTLRVWDLQLGEVVQQVLTAVKELSCFGVDADGRRCVCGGLGKELHVYSLEGVPASPPLEHGVLPRRSAKESLMLSIKFDPLRGLLGIQGSDRTLEVWRVLGEKEVKAKLRRLAKRPEENARKKKRKGPATVADGDGEAAEAEAEAEAPAKATPEPTAWGPVADGAATSSAEPERTCKVELEFLHQLTADHKIRSFDWTETGLVLGTTRNTLERWTIHVDPNRPPARQGTIQSVGHRNHIRAACQSPDDLLLATLSEDAVLVWRIQSATLTCAFPDAKDGRCLRFLQGNKHLVVGTKTGTLDIYSVTTAALVESVKAHTDAVNAFCLSPDSKGLLSGGRDRRVVFWSYALATDPETQTKHISLVEAHSAEMDDAVLDVAYSPDGSKVALALQDNTMKVFYADTFKFVLSLYGHKLPVNALSISSDSQLLVSASMDKNLKIWGLTFGECRKSIFAHDDSITGVSFCPGTHYFFSVSKDCTIKYWDADHFTLVQIIRSHVEGICCLSLNSDASMIVTAGHDRSVRAFSRSEEVIFADEQREEDLEKAQDDETAEKVDRTEGGKAAGHHTAATLKAGEQLSEAIAFVLKVLAHDENKGGPGEEEEEPLTALLFGKTPQAYLVSRLEGIRAADLPHAVSLLPFSQCLSLLTLLRDIVATPPAEPETPPPAMSVELAAKVTLLIAQQHLTYLVQHPELVAVLQDLRAALKARLQYQIDSVGFSSASLAFLQHKAEEETHATFFDLSKRRFHKKAKNRRKRRGSATA